MTLVKSLYYFFSSYFFFFKLTRRHIIFSLKNLIFCKNFMLNRSGSGSPTMPASLPTEITYVSGYLDARNSPPPPW